MAKKAKILTKPGAIELKKCDYIYRQLTQAFKDGRLPYCMDDEEDRRRMAEFIYNHILPL